MVTLLSALLLLAGVKVLGVDGSYDIIKKNYCLKEVQLFLDQAVIFSYDDAFLNDWPGYQPFDCQMVINSRTQTTGIIATIQHLKFRKSYTGECIDYIRFGRDNTLRCGQMIFGLNLTSNGSVSPTPFVSEYAGPFLFGTYRPEMKQLDSPGACVQPESALSLYTRVDQKPFQPGESLLFTIAFTGFKNCDAFDVPTGMFNCGYGVCILRIYVNDGVVNCPFGDCRDEGGCENARKNSIFSGILGNGTEEVTLPASAYTTREIVLDVDRTRRLIQQRQADGDISGVLIGTKFAKQLQNIGDEFKRHNTILERIAQQMEEGVVTTEKEPTIVVPEL